VALGLQFLGQCNDAAFELKCGWKSTLGSCRGVERGGCPGVNTTAWSVASRTTTATKSFDGATGAAAVITKFGDQAPLIDRAEPAAH
jgi:hypothetical protein